VVRSGSYMGCERCQDGWVSWYLFIASAKDSSNHGDVLRYTSLC
jgi:hypothetical protein